MVTELFSSQQALIEHASFSRVCGRVCEVTGLIVVAEGLPLPIGAVCKVDM
ncbi:MAG: flagellum-specific ATP synthase FliI, partial [Planctomycetes bacterium]|nr:flagellum-specific ATP synthase FliI [Planctomycetota bacterium]